MPLEVDHAFIACALEAPEADALLRLGFVEGSSNSHPGQGTADPAKARSERTRRTRLWDRIDLRPDLPVIFTGKTA
jgi:hypothetical protein